jgi:hypothetical protein
MVKQHMMTKHTKHAHIPSWKQLALTTAIFLSAGPFVVLMPGQAAYAAVRHQQAHHQSGHTQAHHQGRHTHDQHIVKHAELGGNQRRFNLLNVLVVCTAGDSGNGGTALSGSSGANGGNGGNCDITVPITIR